MHLLCTDLHLDDQKSNEYRWNVFDEIKRVQKIYGKDIERIYCLGDMVDKKDRHSAVLLNRVVAAWLGLDTPVVILRGNHDTTISGQSFWEFMTHIPNIEYVIKPTAHDNLLLLPFSPNPMAEWKGLQMRDYTAIFLHATVTGAIAENGFALSGQDLPLLPRSAKIYSGDVHNAQQIRNIIYVGASHPVKFGDNYSCRFLLLDEETFEIAKEVPITTISKRTIEIESLDDLSHIKIKKGDQVRIRVRTTPGIIDWGTLESAVEQWSSKNGVEVASIEGSYDLSAQSGSSNPELSPNELLRAFANEENVTDDLLDVGLSLLNEVR